MYYSMLYFIINFVLLQTHACPFDDYGTVSLTFNLETVNETQGDTYKELCVSDEPNLKVVQSLKSIAQRISRALVDGNLIENVQDNLVDNFSVLKNEDITYTRKG